MTRISGLSLTFLMVLLLVPDFRASGQAETLEQVELKQTELGFYFESVRFENNKLVIKMQSSGIRYLLKGYDRVNEYGEEIALPPGASLELTDKHSGLKLTSLKGQPNQTIEIESSFDASDFGGAPSKKKMTLVHVVVKGEEMIVLDDGSKSVVIKPGATPAPF